MTDFDLDAQLHALRPPERSKEYWVDFTARVTRGRHYRPPPRPAPAVSWLPQIAWGFCLAFCCFVLGYYLGHNGVSRQLDRVWRQDRQEIVRFQTQLSAYDEHGLRKQLAEQP